MKAVTPRRKKGFLLRLLTCTLGDGGGQVAVAAVVTGLGITIAAATGAKLKVGTENASQTVAQRSNQGAAGHVAGAK